MMRFWLPLLLAGGILLQGCAVVRSIAGGNIDREQYARAREATMLETRYTAALRLADRLQRNSRIDDADATLMLSEQLVNEAVGQLRGRRGWLDRTTPYTIDSIRAVLYHGSAIASLHLTARSEAHNVDVRLIMDCLLAFTPQDKALRIDIEPFNVVPAVQASGLLTAAEEIIEDVIRVKLGSLKEQFPPMLMPLSFEDTMPVDGVRSEVRSKVNLVLDSPRRLIAYNVRIMDVLLFDGMVVVTVQLDNVKGR